MRYPRKGQLPRSAIAMVMSVALLWSCGKSSHQVAATIEECDPAGYMPCVRDAALLSIPIVNTGLSLTYTSDPRTGIGTGARGTADPGLGGWSIDAVHRYDASQRLLIEGDGAWHEADAVRLPSGERAVPSYDGALAYVFNSAGRHVRTVDGHLGTVLVSITYDAAGRLSAVRGAVNDQPVHVSIKRGADGVPRHLVGIDSGTTVLGADSAGRLTEVTDPAGGRTQIAWGSDGRVTSVMDPLGGVTRYAYDESGNLTSVTDADSVTRRFERRYLRGGFELRVSTPLGRHTVYRTESADGGTRRTLIAPDGSTTTEVVDRHGARTLKVADGTSYEIGAAPSARWGMAAPMLTPTVETRSDGVVSRREEKDALQAQQGLPYAVAGSVTTTINGETWVQMFDPERRSTTLVDPSGRRSVSTYDGDGRLVQSSAPGVAPTAYAYDAQGRVTRETIGSGALAETSTHRFDPATGQAVVVRPDGSKETTNYDAAGRPVSTSDGGGSVAAIHNAASRLTMLVPPGGASFALGTSLAGRSTAFVPPSVTNDSSVEITSYDRDGDVEAITGLGNRAVNVVRDSGARVTEVTFNRGKLAIAYDAHSGRVAQAADPSGVTTTYGFAGDILDRLAWSGPVTASASDSLDPNGRPVAELINGSNVVRLTYDGSGTLRTVGPLSLTRDSATGLVRHSALGAVETSEEYDDNRRLSRATTTVGGKVILDQHYTRDARGRLRSASETTNGTTQTTEYWYDPAGRLAAVRSGGRVLENNVYDAAGNRVAATRSTGRIAASYDDRHRAVSWGTVRYDWAPDGSLRQRAQGSRSVRLTYDDFGSLLEVKLSDGHVITYLVDAEGRRVGRSVDGKLATGYVYRPDGLLAAEVDANGKIVAQFAYDDDDHLVLVERGGVSYRVITDPIGSPRLVLDSRKGSAVAAMSYDAWGMPTARAGSQFLPIGFAGGLQDSATGLVRFGARDYDPDAGRWTTPDPMRFDGGDANLYRYAADDPVNRTDPSGMAPPKGGGGKGGKPPSTGNPPTNTGGGNPPNSGNSGNPKPNPIPGPGPHWTCTSAGPCEGAGPGNVWGCSGGSCGSNNGNFWCKAQHCWGPGGDLCLGAAGAPCSWGEPHFRIGRGSLDFQAVGEFLAATSPDGKFAVQVRQQPLSPASQVALNSAIAANVNGDHIGVYTREPSFLLINDRPVSELEFQRTLPHGGTVYRHGSTVDVAWPDSGRLTVTRSGELLSYGFTPSGSLQGNVRGLLANADTSRTHSLIGRDGAAVSVTDAAFATKLYQQYGNSWRIKSAESLFHYWPGESSAGFTDLTFPTKHVTAASLSIETRSRAEAICRAVGIQSQPTLDACILDVGLTGSPAMAVASLPAASNPSSATTATPGAAPAAAPTPTPAPSGTSTYAIKIGDTVSPDHPAPGAGIATPAQNTQIYTFEARAGDIIYARASSCEGAVISYEIYDSSNHDLGGKINCGDFGPLTLPAAGVYSVRVRADHGTARYTLAVSTTTSDTYSIKIDDTVSANRPTSGAGIIASLGERQTYSFAGRVGQIIYVQVGPCEGASLAFDVLDSANHDLGGKIGCGDFGPLTLPSAGLYRIVAQASQGTARYTFVLRDTRFDTYSIRVGDTVSPDRPTSGAGIITLPGERQAYTFPARAGEVISIHAGPCEGALLGFDVIDPANHIIGGRGGCGDFEPLTMRTAGVYRIIVHADRGTARYTLVVR